MFFQNRDLAKLSNHQLTYYRRESVGFVFQSYNLVPSLTALENVALVTEISPNPMHPMDALDIVGLKDRANHFPSQMSGGEQQRVAIARAIANTHFGIAHAFAHAQTLGRASNVVDRYGHCKRWTVY